MFALLCNLFLKFLFMKALKKIQAMKIHPTMSYTFTILRETFQFRLIQHLTLFTLPIKIIIFQRTYSVDHMVSYQILIVNLAFL